MKTLPRNICISSAVFFTSVLFVAGCVQPQHGYVNPTSENFARPEVATLYDMKTAVADLVAQMQDDERFREHYELLASKKRGLPVLQISNIENDTEDRVAQKLESVRNRLQVALYGSGLFDIIDDADSRESVSEDVAGSITVNADIGLNDGAGLQAFGKHVSADYQIRGRYREFADGRRHSYTLFLQLIDLHNGKQVWSGIEDIDKE
jgi:PBP1b-binding outer membrane lipoprotein LpoB